jgi:hypothetical protein
VFARKIGLPSSPNLCPACGAKVHGNRVRARAKLKGACVRISGSKRLVKKLVTIAACLRGQIIRLRGCFLESMMIRQPLPAATQRAEIFVMQLRPPGNMANVPRSIQADGDSFRLIEGPP